MNFFRYSVSSAPTIISSSCINFIIIYIFILKENYSTLINNFLVYFIYRNTALDGDNVFIIKKIEFEKKFHLQA